MWFLATVNCGMHLQATLLGKCHLAATFWADERSLTGVRSLMPFQIGFTSERLASVREDSLTKVFPHTLPQNPRGHILLPIAQCINDGFCLLVPSPRQVLRVFWLGCLRNTM